MTEPTDPIALLRVSNPNGYMLVSIPGADDGPHLTELQNLVLIHPEFKRWDIENITWEVVVIYD